MPSSKEILREEEKETTKKEEKKMIKEEEEEEEEEEKKEEVRLLDLVLKTARGGFETRANPRGGLGRKGPGVWGVLCRPWDKL